MSRHMERVTSFLARRRPLSRRRRARLGTPEGPRAERFRWPRSVATARDWAGVEGAGATGDGDTARASRRRGASPVTGASSVTRALGVSSVEARRAAADEARPAALRLPLFVQLCPRVDKPSSHTQQPSSKQAHKTHQHSPVYGSQDSHATRHSY